MDSGFVFLRVTGVDRKAEGYGRRAAGAEIPWKDKA